MPMINFIILEYSNGSKSEVFWGWVDSLSGSQGSASEVFRSDDASIVKMFSDLFSNMVQKKCDVSIQTDFSKLGDAKFRSKNTGEVVDKEGIWYTRAYRRKNLGVSSPQARSCAVFKIIFQNGKPFITGVICDFANKEFEPIDHSKIEKVENASNKIFIEFHKKIGGAAYDGYVVYDFKHIEMAQLDIVSGFFIDPETTGRYDIVGFKVNSDFSIEPSKSTLAKLDAEHKDMIAKIKTELL